MLKKWAKRLLAWRDKGIDSYIYFDNDRAGMLPSMLKHCKN
jgi:uncharacterized protein YecE (DUF72 family)